MGRSTQSWQGPPISRSPCDQTSNLHTASDLQSATGPPALRTRHGLAEPPRLRPSASCPSHLHPTSSERPSGGGRGEAGAQWSPAGRRPLWRSAAAARPARTLGSHAAQARRRRRCQAHGGEAAVQGPALRVFSQPPASQGNFDRSSPTMPVCTMLMLSFPLPPPPLPSPRPKQIMQQRLQQLGGRLEPALVPGGTTHVVCAPAMTRQEVEGKLKGYQGCAGLRWWWWWRWWCL